MYGFIIRNNIVMSGNVKSRHKKRKHWLLLVSKLSILRSRFSNAEKDGRVSLRSS